MPRNVRPSPTQRTALGLLVGLILGVLAAFVRDAFDTRVRSSGETGDVLGLPVLGRIPANTSRVATGSAIAMVADPAGAQADAFRFLRSNIELLREDYTTLTILVSSPGQGDGKSTVAANLAVALAQAGHRVALLDADSRRPAVETLLEVPYHAGVEDVARGTIALREALVRVDSVEEDEAHDGSLDVLLGRPRVAAAFERLAYGRAVAELRDDYDFVIVDGPPLLAGGEALGLSVIVDGLLIVCSLDSLRRANVEGSCPRPSGRAGHEVRPGLHRRVRRRGGRRLLRAHPRPRAWPGFGPRRLAGPARARKATRLMHSTLAESQAPSRSPSFTRGGALRRRPCGGQAPAEAQAPLQAQAPSEAADLRAAAAPRTVAVADRLARSPARRRRIVVRRMLMAADIVGLLGAFAISEIVTAQLSPDRGVSATRELMVLLLAIPVWVAIGQIHHVYENDVTRAAHTAVDDFNGVFHTITVGTVGIYVAAHLTRIAQPDLTKMSVFWAVSIGLVMALRIAARARFRRHETFHQNAVVLGAGTMGQIVARKLRQHPEFGVNVVGFLDTSPARTPRRPR